MPLQSVLNKESICSLTISNILFTALDTVHEFHIGLVEGSNYFLSHLQITEECPTLANMEPYRYKYNEQLSRFGGQYDYGFRMYNAGLGRFLSVDLMKSIFISPAALIPVPTVAQPPNTIDITTKKEKATADHQLVNITTEGIPSNIDSKQE